jgi:hypothetical protein
MDKIIERAISLYVKGFITKDELAGIIAKEYSKLWANGQILRLMNE